MKILIAVPNNTENSYTDDLAKGLSLLTECKTSIFEFWCENNFYDVVHIHWPEILFEWKEPTDKQLNLLESRLQHWSKKAKIICTRHNLHPHYRDTKAFLKLYDIVYSYCNGVIHLGEFSKTEYLTRYKNNYFIRPQQQFVIPHQLYPNLPNLHSVTSARKKIGIGKEQKVMLVFGALRDKEEFDIVLDSFRNLNIKNKCLIANRWYTHKQIGFRNPLAKFKQFRQDVSFAFNSSYKLFNKFTTREENEILFKTSNVVLIPRKKALNSGNLALGFGYGKVVVGSSFGNIGEILQRTGNPTYNDYDHVSVSNAIERGFELDKGGQGGKNLMYGLNHWNLELILELHLDAYNCLYNKS
ncbi:hypothetical protein [Pontibacter harenae]|uniref:hypothetical protein n=1 Tax=Pontibacter harenae TaxID=2894083 RepID=UPI001E5F0CE5|nr:hypothetical protein [Pontibacter harenae]MCC9168230.1 hypothetical protein [Pontibacter harenae]